MLGADSIYVEPYAATALDIDGRKRDQCHARDKRPAESKERSRLSGRSPEDVLEAGRHSRWDPAPSPQGDAVAD